MYCNKCGKEVNETSIYCSICGAKIGLSNDPIIDGMQPFGVNENQSIKNENTTDWGSIFEGIFMLLGILILNGIFFAVTYLTTPSLVKAFNEHSDTSITWFYHLLIYTIPLILWQWANDKIFKWSDDFHDSSLENISFLTYFSMFIPIVPTIISLYFLTKNEYLFISIQNFGIFGLAFGSCWYYYLVNKH